MLSKPYVTPLLERSISGTEFKVDVVTVCLTSSCSECKGEYVNHVLGHKFVCQCKCHGGEHEHCDYSAVPCTHCTNCGVKQKDGVKKWLV